jgi:hypothetical protein
LIRGFNPAAFYMLRVLVAPEKLARSEVARRKIPGLKQLNGNPFRAGMIFSSYCSRLPRQALIGPPKQNQELQRGALRVRARRNYETPEQQ